MDRDLYLHEYQPKPALTTQETRIERPRFSVVDAHNHLGYLIPNASFAGKWPTRPVHELVEVLDSADVRAIVDLDGGYGEGLRRELERYRGPYPERFIVFAGVEYEAFGRERDIGGYLARQLRDSAAAGAQGLKIWKLLGLRLRDEHGALVPVNDPRLDELWATAGELKLPVLIHVADPVAFFDPLDRYNERWEELHGHPDWHFYGGDFPTFAELMDQFSDMVTRHRNTTFIGAHLGCYAENLAWVAEMLDRCPNFYVEPAGRLAELGRQPYTTRDFFIRYSDRILFGMDLPPSREDYLLHYRFFETRDEYFNYSLQETPPQGRWMIYGLHLPDDVLRRLYYENATRLLPL